MLKVRVEYYGILQETCGTRVEEVEFDEQENVTVSQAVSHLSEQHPGLSAYREYMACALDTELSEEDSILHDGAVLALLPPVSGG